MTEELLWCKAPINQFWTRRARIPPSHSYERSQEISDPWKVGTQIYWSIPGYVSSGYCCISIRTTAELADVHSVFRVSQLRRCISPPEKKHSMAEVELANDLTYEERPFRILDQMERVTRSKVRKFYKVQWEHPTESESTWEREEFPQLHYLEWFSQATESRGRDSF